MNILAIQGSFRDNGMTTTMLRYAVKKAEAAGHQVKYVKLHEKKINYCLGCRKCFENYGCIFRDDIQEMTQDMQKADVIFLAAPVYWANVPGIVKNLFDRLVGAAMEETEHFPKPRLSGKKYILLTACNTPSPFSYLAGQVPGCNRTVKEFFKTAGVKCIGRVVVCNTGKRNQVPEKQLKRIERFLHEMKA